jgi:hypothetical protein
MMIINVQTTTKLELAVKSVILVAGNTGLLINQKKVEKRPLIR